MMLSDLLKCDQAGLEGCFEGELFSGFCSCSCSAFLLLQFLVEVPSLGRAGAARFSHGG